MKSKLKSYATQAIKNLSLSYIKKQPISFEFNDQNSSAFQIDYLEDQLLRMAALDICAEKKQLRLKDYLTSDHE